jgi:hypothetical protein
MSLKLHQFLLSNFENTEMLQNLQLLLGVKFDNILLRIVFELINNLLEAKPNLISHFNNTFTVDILLKIFEDYTEQELKIGALDTLQQLCKEDIPDSKEIIFLFRKLGGPQKLINQLSYVEDNQVKLNILNCIQCLTQDDQDILIEFKDLNIVEILLDLIVESEDSPLLICQTLACFTNMALND